MVISPVVAVCQAPLTVVGAPEFAAPNYKRIVEEASLLQIQHQRSRSLVRLPALLLNSQG